MTDHEGETDSVVDDRVETPGEAGESASHKPVGRRLLRLLVVIALLAPIVASAAVAVNARNRAADAESALDQRDEIRLVSASFGEAYLSYDFRAVEASSERVLALSTDGFASRFEDQRVAEIDALFANIESTTVSRTTAVYLGDVSDTTATTFVVVDVEATSAAMGTQTLKDLSFVVDLVRIEGSWLVDEVAPPPQADVAGAAGSGSDGSDDPDESDDNTEG